MLCGEFLFHLLVGFLDFVYNKINSIAQIIVFGGWVVSWVGGCFVNRLELRRVDGPKANIL